MFDAHHLSPLVLEERESLVSDLVALCPTCHRWAHAKAGDRLHPHACQTSSSGETPSRSTEQALGRANGPSVRQEPGWGSEHCEAPEPAPSNHTNRY